MHLLGVLWSIAYLGFSASVYPRKQIFTKSVAAFLRLAIINSFNQLLKLIIFYEGRYFLMDFIWDPMAWILFIHRFVWILWFGSYLLANLHGIQSLGTPLYVNLRGILLLGVCLWNCAKTMYITMQTMAIGSMYICVYIYIYMKLC